MAFDSPRHPGEVRGPFELRAAEVFQTGIQDNTNVFALSGISDPISEIGVGSVTSQPCEVNPSFPGAQYSSQLRSMQPVSHSIQDNHFAPMTSSEISELVSADELFNSNHPNPNYAATASISSGARGGDGKTASRHPLNLTQPETSACSVGGKYSKKTNKQKSPDGKGKGSKSKKGEKKSKEGAMKTQDANNNSSGQEMSNYYPNSTPIHHHHHHHHHHHVMPGMPANGSGLPLHPSQQMQAQMGSQQQQQQQLSANTSDNTIQYQTQNETHICEESTHQTGSVMNGSMMLNECNSMATSPPLNSNLMQQRRDHDSNRWLNAAYPPRNYNYYPRNTDYIGEENIQFPPRGPSNDSSMNLSGKKYSRVPGDSSMVLAQNNRVSSGVFNNSNPKDKGAPDKDEKPKSKRASVRALGVSALLPVPLQLNHNEVIQMWGKGRNILTEYNPNEMTPNATLDHAAILEKFDAAAGLMNSTNAARRSHRDRGHNQGIEEQIERRARSMRYREKRRNRKAGPSITRYEIRKIMALARPRVKVRSVFLHAAPIY